MDEKVWINEHLKEIEQLERDLIRLTKWDWDFERLHGEEKVDYYKTAIALLKAGYRKE